MDTQAKIEADRTALYRAEAAGLTVQPEAWLALGARQELINAGLYNAQGYITRGWSK